MTIKAKAIKRKTGLTKEAIKAVKSDTAIVAKIILATGKSYPTIMRWLDLNLEMLTTAKCLNVICECLNKEPNEILAENQ